MESLPQNPEFRNNPENFHSCQGSLCRSCYKNDRVATDLFHWRKVHFHQTKSPFLPIMVQNLLTDNLYVNTCILLCGVSNIGQTGSLDNYQLPTAEAIE